MIKCQNCGAELRFDPVSQKMKCAYCGTYSPVPEDNEETAAKETYNVNIFTCPNCGGEINSSAEEAGGFCPYCGESVQFGKRMAAEHRPVKIIPFTVTKDQCRDIYRKKINQAYFAPDDMKDPKYIDNFIGIYMPYWIYKIHLAGTMTGDSRSSTDMGSYDLIQEYHNSCETEADFDGPSYDASLSFSDAISRDIAPYNTRKAVKFQTGYTDGFYTDADTVSKDDHLNEAEDDAIEETKNEIANKKFPGTVSSVSFDIKEKKTMPELALFPVWFMSYKNGSRIAYTVINGQTGKIHADIPVDFKKCLKTVALITLAAGFILSFFTIVPKTMMRISAFMLLTASLIYNSTLKKDTSDVIHADNSGKKMPIKVLSGKFIRTGFLIFIFFSFFTSGIKIMAPIIWVIIMIIACSKKPASSHGYVFTFILMILASFIIFVITVFNPADDLWYYGPAILSILVSVLAAVKTIKQMNIQATHKIPQFNRKGGNKIV